METGKGVSPATSQKKKYAEDNILFGLYFTFCPKFFNKRKRFQIITLQHVKVKQVKQPLKMFSYYKIAVAEITNFVRGTCKGLDFSGSGFTIALYSFPKY